jgi:hypothetical protein
MKKESGVQELQEFRRKKASQLLQLLNSCNS